VIPLFIEQIKQNRQMMVTNKNMTRFLMSLDEAVELVLFAYHNAGPGDLLIQKAPACTIGDLAQAVRELFDPEAQVVTIGVRHGEKLYETLATSEEKAKAIDLGDYWLIPPDGRDLNYGKYFDNGEGLLDNAEPYTSHNTERLNVEQIKNKLLELEYVQNELKDWRR
jgi:UDP-glucose 4-epimerase